jgi:hypothetical protein
MTQGRRILAIAVVAVVAVVGFVVAKAGDKSSRSSAAVLIQIKGGKPVGGIREITANKGDPVRFTVDSDVSDEIHVHGYDFHENVKAGGRASFSFPAKIDGVFVIELESRAEQIASLQVQP